MSPSERPSFEWRVTSRWRTLQGSAWGVGPGVLCGALDINITRAIDFSMADEVMGRLVEEPLPRIDASTAESALVDRAAFWTGALQRQQKIPAFGPAHFAEIPGPHSQDGWKSFELALPLFRWRPTETVLAWVLKSVQSLHDAGAVEAVQASFDRLMLDLQDFALPGLNNFHIANAARQAGIPAVQLSGAVFAYGLGHKTRLFNSTVTQTTSAIGATLSRSKDTTTTLLRKHGVPVPGHRFAQTAQEAVEIAQALGYPVVVKPDDQQQGIGVEAGLREPDEVRRAWAAASKVSNAVLVEKHHFGEDYRLTVLGGQVVKILHRRAGGVAGDGVHSVEELVDAEMRTPRMQRVLRQTGRTLLALDDEAKELLGKAGLAPASVPARGGFVALRRRNNISAGGIQTLVDTADAHPDNLALAVRATSAMRLDLCGVDMLIPDIARSWLETGCVIIEMNVKPQIGIQTAPEVYLRILRHSVPDDGRIPVHVLVCATDADVPGEAEALALMAAAGCDGVSMKQGTWQDGKQTAVGFPSAFDAARALLLADVRAALLVTTAQEIVDLGLPADRCDTVTVRRSRPANPQQEVRLAQVLAMVRPHAGKIEA